MLEKCKDIVSPLKWAYTLHVVSSNHSFHIARCFKFHMGSYAKDTINYRLRKKYGNAYLVVNTREITSTFSWRHIIHERSLENNIPCIDDISVEFIEAFLLFIEESSHFGIIYNPLGANFNKMVKRNQTSRR